MSNFWYISYYLTQKKLKVIRNSNLSTNFMALSSGFTFLYIAMSGYLMANTYLTLYG